MHAITLLALATTALGSPLVARAYPPLSTAKAYRLFINVTKPAQDFTPSIHGLEIGRAPLGDSTTLFRAVAVPPSTGTILFQNPNEELAGEINAPYFSSTLSVSAGGAHIQGMQLHDTDDNGNFHPGPQYDVNMNVGIVGSEGMELIPEMDGQGVARAQPSAQGMFMAYIVCNTTTVGGHLTLDALEWSSWGPDFSLHVPAGCLNVQLLPQCETEEHLIGSGVSDEVKAAWAKAETVRCYEDVKSIDWRGYTWP